MPGPGRHSFFVDPGADLDKTFTYYKSGSLFNFTGYTALMQIRDAPGGTILATLSTANGRISLGGAAGTCRLIVDSTITDTWDWSGRAYYDIFLDGATEFYLVEGRVSLRAVVSEP